MNSTGNKTNALNKTEMSSLKAKLQAIQKKNSKPKSSVSYKKGTETESVKNESVKNESVGNNNTNSNNIKKIEETVSDEDTVIEGLNKFERNVPESKKDIEKSDFIKVQSKKNSKNSSTDMKVETSTKKIVVVSGNITSETTTKTNKLSINHPSKTNTNVFDNCEDFSDEDNSESEQSNIYAMSNSALSLSEDDYFLGDVLKSPSSKCSNTDSTPEIIERDLREQNQTSVFKHPHSYSMDISKFKKHRRTKKITAKISNEEFKFYMSMNSKSSKSSIEFDSGISTSTTTVSLTSNPKSESCLNSINADRSFNANGIKVNKQMEPEFKEILSKYSTKESKNYSLEIEFIKIRKEFLQNNGMSLEQNNECQDDSQGKKKGKKEKIKQSHSPKKKTEPKKKTQDLIIEQRNAAKMREAAIKEKTFLEQYLNDSISGDDNLDVIGMRFNRLTDESNKRIYLASMFKKIYTNIEKYKNLTLKTKKKYDPVFVLKVLCLNIVQNYGFDHPDFKNILILKEYISNKKEKINKLEIFYKSTFKDDPYEFQMLEAQDEIFQNRIFVKPFSFDNHQIKSMEYINNSKNFVLDVETSGGKSLVAKYLAFCYDSCVFIINNQSALQQFAADLSSILGKSQHTFNKKICVIDGSSITNRDDDDIIVSTPENFLEYLLLTGVSSCYKPDEDSILQLEVNNDSCLEHQKWKYIFFDDFHGINDKIEYTRLFNVAECIICSTASISNPYEVAEFIDKERRTGIFSEDPDKVESTKTFVIQHRGRHINKEELIYKDGDFIKTNILSYLKYEDFNVPTIDDFKYSLKLTPEGLYKCWHNINSIYKNVENEIIKQELKLLEPNETFDVIVDSSKLVVWENKLLSALITFAHYDKNIFEQFLNLYHIEEKEPTSLDVQDVYDLLMAIKNNANHPCLVFVDNPLDVIELSKELYNFLISLKQRRYPLEEDLRIMETEISKKISEINGSSLKINSNKGEDSDAFKDRIDEEKLRAIINYTNSKRNEISSLICCNIKKWKNELKSLYKKFKDSNIVDENSKVSINDLLFKIKYYEKELKKYLTMDMVDIKSRNKYGTHPACTFFDNLEINDTNNAKNKLENLVLASKKNSKDFKAGNYDSMFIKLYEHGIVLMSSVLPQEIMAVSHLLLNEGKTKIIISDNTLEAGVNFAIKTVVQLNFVNFKPERFYISPNTNCEVIDESEEIDFDISLIEQLDIKPNNIDKPIGNTYVDPNTASQRSGRAGRRGLDTIAYNCMAGKSSQILSTQLKCTGIDQYKEKYIDNYILASVINSKFVCSHSLSLNQYVNNRLFEIKDFNEKMRRIEELENLNKEILVKTKNKVKMDIELYTIQPDLLFSLSCADNTKELILLINFLFWVMDMKLSSKNSNSKSDVQIEAAILSAILPGNDNSTSENDIINSFNNVMENRYSKKNMIRHNDFIIELYKSMTLNKIGTFEDKDEKLQDVYKTRNILKRMEIIFNESDFFVEQDPGKIKINRLKGIITKLTDIFDSIIIKYTS